MIILDTNVLSETLRPTPARQVLEWMDAQASTSLFTTAITEAEMRLGAAILPAGRRREAIHTALEGIFGDLMDGRVLPFDSDAARQFAVIAAARRAAGRPISGADAQIAAIAWLRGATVATRNVMDFSDCGVALVNP